MDIFYFLVLVLVVLSRKDNFIELIRFKNYFRFEYIFKIRSNFRFVIEFSFYFDLFEDVNEFGGVFLR